MIKNLDKVHPIKRQKVQEGMEFIERLNEDGMIQKVILFGSSITKDCTEDSDIDVCFVTEETCENWKFFQVYGGLPLIMEDLCDILVYRDLKGNLKDEIDRKGIVIYEKSNFQEEITPEVKAAVQRVTEKYKKALEELAKGE